MNEGWKIQKVARLDGLFPSVFLFSNVVFYNLILFSS